MKVTIKQNPRACTFESIGIGECFIYSGVPYIKIAGAKLASGVTVTAVEPKTGLLVAFSLPQTIVTECDAELIVSEA